jgi:DNA primase small subunit
MDENDRRLMTKLFSSYYGQAELGVLGIEQREFGVGFSRKIESRHLAFAHPSELRNYLMNNTPFFVSHSISYYEHPSATPMEKKIWKGADLVFDLDLHAEGKYGAYMLLDKVKSDLSRLVTDFIKGDFGCTDVMLAFSGNRGYHVHVRDKEFRTLGGEERRELVDYIMGNGLNYRDFFSESGDKKTITKLHGPNPEEGGYRGRFAKMTLKALGDDPGSIHKSLKEEKTRNVFVRSIMDGNWSTSPVKKNSELIERLAPIAKSLPVASVDTDAGVTQDLSKLIRVPNSIHGDTGLIAKVFDASGLEGFEPLRDALMPTNQELKVKFIEDVPELPLRGEATGPFKKDEEKRLNLAVAAFYVLKGSATILKGDAK